MFIWRNLKNYQSIKSTRPVYKFKTYYHFFIKIYPKYGKIQYVCVMRKVYRILHFLVRWEKNSQQTILSYTLQLWLQKSIICVFYHSRFVLTSAASLTFVLQRPNPSCWCKKEQTHSVFNNLNYIKVINQAINSIVHQQWV